MKVKNRNCEDNDDEKEMTWQSLVLVKQPFQKVPHLAQLKKFYNKEEEK
jgi:hypothetical protein